MGSSSAVLKERRHEGSEQRTVSSYSRPLLQSWSSAHLRRAPAIAQRKQLIADGMLVEKGDLVFTKDTQFTSPSAAAAVIHGGSANGLIVWKSSDGKSLKQLDEQS